MTETVAPAKLESTTGPRAASDDAKPGNERGQRQTANSQKPAIDRVASHAHKTKQFWLIWVVLCLNAIRLWRWILVVS